MSGTIVRFRGDGLELVGEAFGDPAAPPVLFFHGGGQSRNAWRGSARIVGDSGYYGATFDLRGHGDSAWAADGDYLLEAFGRDVEALLGQFSRPVTLVGASRGGQASLVGGSRHPSRVRLVVLADVAPLMRDQGVDGIRAFFSEGEAGFPTLDQAADSLARHLDQPRLSDSTRLARAMRQDAAGRWHWRWDPATGRAEFLHPPSEGEAILAAAARMTSPIVLVRAELSHLLTDQGVDRFRELTPQLKVVVAKGVGHMFTADRNDGFAADLLDWLEQTPERVAA
ncbi:alpha/beta fold hydrolase [Novosphingobium sp. AAP93]|uniref:alpha/beta fold hydrolase n=1 Tax=Novosphingobium sp. AAP93 TaxID=1523427 RepID=UPI000A445878|nr:alpha/beta fold hydrolase [Novosphingobium sp. AAP93]